MAAGGTNLFTIPPGVSFVDALAARLLAEAEGDPLKLSAALILLPTRRACRSLREAFLRASGGKPLLLPRMMPLGEADEDELWLAGEGELDLPPAIPPLSRQLLLARQILRLGAMRGGQPPTPEQAAQLAQELATLLDSVQTEGLSFDRLAGLVPDELAAHWQITLEFLKVLTEHWPGVLDELGHMDPAARRGALLAARSKAWEANPPKHPVIAAGSTGSIPATADLLSVIAGLPQGRVVLPGLDLAMDGDSWEALDQTHPQFGLKRLLDHMGAGRDDVRSWGVVDPRPQRSRLISEVMRPAATTEAWRVLSMPDAALALVGMTRLDCPGPREEAGAIALLLREALQFDGKTAALVTPDRALARRVAGELERWGISIDDSAGRPLPLTAPGAYLRLVAEAVAEQFAPHPLLALLKHPLSAGGSATGSFKARVRRLEQAVLRGPRPAPGIAGLRAALGKKHVELDPWLAGLEALFAPLVAVMALPEVPLIELVRAHVQVAEALATDDTMQGAARLWSHEAGEAAAKFIAELKDASGTLPPLWGGHYPGLLEALMAGVVVRPRWGGHPRLHIWGPLEARLQHADLLILGGLNEGTWPPQAGSDPWMSRPMRSAFGLPLPERRIGLSAHDFAQALGAPEVVLTRSLRVDGTPTVPSRWLLRLDAVLKALGVEGAWPEAAPLVEWHGILDRPERFERVQAPAPKPPVAARPRKLSATQIETWMRDPYAIYARHVLGLRALDEIDADPAAADYGTLIHAALDAFTKAYPRHLPADPEAELLRLGQEAFADHLARPGVWAFWWPRFARIAAWVAAHERGRRHRVMESRSEVEGAIELHGPVGPFTVTAKADRVDLMQDQTIAILDYKTGKPPGAKEVAAGFAPQLPIEAAIARAGGFTQVPGRPVSELLYWHLKGGETGGLECPAGDDAQGLADDAVAGLQRLIEAFDDPETPYAARPHPERAPKYSDYLHLARVKEWAAMGEDGDE